MTPRAGRAGVRPGACPRSHLPPSRESPRAGPRARQCARAALPSTAGGGGGGGGPGGGARRCPQAAPRPVRLGALRPQLRPALASEGVGRGEGPPGAPWAGAGSFRGRPSSEPQWRAGDLLNLPGPIARARPRAGRAGDTCPEAGPRPRGLKPRCRCVQALKPESGYPRLLGHVGRGDSFQSVDAADDLLEAPSCQGVEPPPSRGREARILLKQPQETACPAPAGS